MEERIRKAVDEALVQAGAPNVSFVVERPADMNHGDHATNAALAAAKVLGKNPRSLADELAKFLMEKLGKDIASHVTVAGPGFVNITLARGAVSFAVAEADVQGSEWGKGNVGAGQKVMIEYTDPNPFKEMHIGHLMSNTIGEAIARLIENTGAEVKRANYQGDVGLHVAKAVYARTFPSNVDNGVPWGVAYKMGNDLYESGSSHKKEIDEINKKIYDRSDEKINKIYDQGIIETLKDFEKIYEKLGMKPIFVDSADKVHFNFYFYESHTWRDGLELVKQNTPKIFSESDGAIIYRGEQDGLHTRVFVTSKGLPTYETKELGLAKLKSDRWNFDISITITASEQKDYFQVVLAVLRKIMPAVASKIQHITHGMMRFSEGKMSSRKGNVITALAFLQDLLDVAKERARASLADDPDKLAMQVALAAAKYQILKQASSKDIIFDRGRALSLEGDSGPYLQYALVRARSVLERATNIQQPTHNTAPAEPARIERIMLHFPEVAARAARELAPNLLVNYLTELAGEWNSFYAQERIIGGDHEAHKLMLARAFVNTMTNGLVVLGIPTPEKM